MTDLAFNADHANVEVEITPISNNEKVCNIHKAVLNLWHMVEITNKGKYLPQIKPKINYWPWSCHRNRTVETLIAKLRIGHANSNQNKYRFQLTPSPVCSCGLIILYYASMFLLCK